MNLMDSTAYLLVNFGGPRDLNEIEEFLIALLTDQEVIRTSLPAFIHRWFFTRVAKKRSRKIAPDYALIGGKSPIFEDTEAIADSVGEILGAKVLTFHRYLPKTYTAFIEQMENLSDCSEIRVFPMFPQFSTATTGSIALWFATHLSPHINNKMAWVKSCPGHPSYIEAMDSCLRTFLKETGWQEEECALLFSAHGLPQEFIRTGDVYETECQLTFNLIKDRFPKALSLLSYQSQFGKGEWIRPYTNEVCEQMAVKAEGRQKVVVVPLSFTSDHIETLYEIEELYLPVIRRQGMQAARCPALNRRPEWIEAIAQMFRESANAELGQLLRSS
jgi:ferrochelatase